MSYQNLIPNARQTPQSQPARADQVPNNAGGYAFVLDKWQRLEQFLILGTEAGTYYVNARDLTVQNLDNVKACLAEDGPRVVQMAVDISRAGRAIKNDPAILVLAAALTFGNTQTKHDAQHSINQVCRTGTFILHFAAYADKLRRWGRALRTAVANWYENQQLDPLAYQMVKYQQRDGWSQKDLIRKSHVGSGDPQRAALYDWALHGIKEGKTYPKIVYAFDTAKTAEPAALKALIEQDGLSREMIPTEKLNDPVVARALALQMPMTAMIRNLGNLSKAGLLVPGDDVFTRVITQLHDLAALKKARIHPLALLIALKTYASGHGLRSSGQWPVVPQVVDALNDAFYLAFDAVDPIGKNLLVAVDSSGSMHAEITNTPGFSAAEAAAAMTLVTVRTEPVYTSLAFDTATYEWAISPRQRLDDVMAHIPGGGGTDVSAPIRWATEHQRRVDAIVIYTDNETWYGDQHPYQAMTAYRQRINPQAKLVVVAATATGLSVAASDDPLSLTVCGFDASIPEVLRAFLA